MVQTIICPSSFHGVLALLAILVSADAERIMPVFIALVVAALAIKGAIHQIL